MPKLSYHRPDRRSVKQSHLSRFFRPVVELLESRRLLSVGGADSDVLAAYGQTAMSFEPNVGQTDAQVRFVSRGEGYTLFLTSAAEAVLDLAAAPTPTRSASEAIPSSGLAGAGASEAIPSPGLAGASGLSGPVNSAAASVLDVQLVGGNTAPQAAGLDQLSGVSNYLIGNDPSQWHTGVANFARVEYQSVYAGVDLAYYGNQGRLEYDFTVAPGADPGAIKLNFEGADSIDIDAQGNLVLHTSGGDVVEHAPMAYQEIGGAKQVVLGQYVLEGDHQVGFRIGGYDADQPLVIDPVLIYSTYLGGSGADVGNAIAVDSAGSAYITGQTTSVNFPGVVLDPGPAPDDAFVTKLDPSGTKVVWTTLLGGLGAAKSDGSPRDSSYGRGIAVGADGHIYVTGATSSPDFPAVDKVRPQHTLDYFEVFVTRLQPNGDLQLDANSRPVDSVFLGGDSESHAGGIAIDKDGNAYVTGSTIIHNFESATLVNFPTTDNAYLRADDPAFLGFEFSSEEGFLSKVGPDGTLLYSTLLSKDDNLGQGFGTGGDGVAVDSKGMVYITGATFDESFPTKAGPGSKTGKPYQADFGDQSWFFNFFSAFVEKFDTSLGGDASLIYSTLLEGDPAPPTPDFIASGNGDFGVIQVFTQAYGIAVDAQGDAYVTGRTTGYYQHYNSANSLVTLINFDTYPTTAGAVQPSYGGGDSKGYLGDAFVTELNPTADALIYSTYLGGSGDEIAHAIALDKNGNAYVSGFTNSSDLRTTANAPQQDFVGGPDIDQYTKGGDGFVAEVEAGGTKFTYLTYLGGSGNEAGEGIAVDAHGSAYVTGGTVSSDFPTAPATPLQPPGGGTGDAFVTKISGTDMTLTALNVAFEKNVPLTTPVASLTTQDTSLPASNFTVTIVWGDGAVTPKVTPVSTAKAGTFLIQAPHTYTKPGAYPVVVTVHDTLDNTDATTAVDVSGAPGNQGETTIAVNPKDPSQLFEASNDEAGTAAAKQDPTKGGLFAAYSTDGGATWTPTAAPGHLLADGSGQGGDSLPAFRSDPRAIFDQFGNLFLAYVGSDLNTMVVALSIDGGKTFTKVGSLQPAGVGGPPSVDFPSIAVGPGADPKDPNSGSVWVAFADLVDGSIVAYGAPVAGPGAGGVGAFPANAEVVAKPNPGATNFNFASIAVGPAGQVLVSWQDNASYDGDTQIGLGPDNILVSLNSNGLASEGVGKGGFGAPVIVTSTNVGAKKPILAQFTRKIMANATLAWDRSGQAHQGRVYLAYTDSFDPLDADTTINLRYSDDNGATWTPQSSDLEQPEPPIRVDDTDGKHGLFEPTVAVDETTGNVAVAWIDARNDPNDVKTQVFVATSGDGGKTFSPSVQVSVGSSDATDPGLNDFGKRNQYGDFQGLVFNAGMLYPSWTDNSRQSDGKTPALSGNPDLPQFDAAAASIGVANVTVAPIIVRGEMLTVTEGETFTGQEVALFIDNDSTLTEANFTADINWGDGKPETAGAIVKNATPDLYEVDGSHTYASSGAFPLVVTVHNASDGIDGSNGADASDLPGNESSVSIAVDPTDSTRRFLTANTDDFKGILVATSTDGGAIWHSRVIADGNDDLTGAYGYPRAEFDSFGNLFLAYIDSTGQGIAVALSQDGGQTFDSKTDAHSSVGVGPPSIATGPDANSTPAMPAADTWFYAKDLALGAFRPFVFVTSGLGMVQSVSGESLPASADDNFGSIAIGPSGQLLALVQDSGPDGADRIFTNLDPDGSGPAAFGAPVFATDTRVVGSSYVIPAEQQRGITSQASLAWDRGTGSHAGRAYLVYTDATAVGSDDTNIFVRTSDDAGSHWSAPVRVNDDVGQASQFLPSIALDPSTGNVVIGWYDTRNDPLKVKSEFFVATSADGGKTFTPNVAVSRGPSNATDPRLDTFGVNYQYGNYTGMAFSQGIFSPAWADNSAEMTASTRPGEFEVAAGSFGVAQVADAPLTAKAIAVSAKEGQSFTKNVASFSDADTAAKAADFTAMIDWGDETGSATTSPGTIATDGNGGMVVSGTHAYLEEGTYTEIIVIKDAGGSSATTTGTTTVADSVLTATGSSLNVVGGQLSGIVASFTDDDPKGVASDYTATIDWGDATTSAGAITTGAAAGFAVSGTHAYAADGNYPITVRIGDAGGATATAMSSASVAPPPPTVAADQPTVFALQGIPTGVVAVASFTAAPSASGGVLGQYTATVDWFDGNGPVAASAAITGTSVMVSANHVFDKGGPASFDVTLTDPSGSSTVAHLQTTVRTDVTSRTQPASTGLVFNPATQRFVGQVTITNASATDVTGPLPVVFRNLPVGVTLANATGTTGAGDPYLMAPTATLAVGQASTFEVDFNDPTMAAINYSLAVFDPPPAGAATTAQLGQAYGQIPLSFEPNVGQADGQVQFLSRGNGYALFLTSDEAVLGLAGANHPAGTADMTAQTASQSTVRLQLIGANTATVPVGIDPLPGTSNYLVGNDPSQWHTNIPTYAQVEYKQVYAGVDLIYYGNQQQLEYDFVVAAGADPGQIHFAVVGAEFLTLDAGGNLIVHTMGGDIIQRAPRLYQEIGGARIDVSGRFLLEAGNRVGFIVGDYDPSRPLTIDPVLVYSTYLGGGTSVGYYDGSTAADIATDGDGNAYIVGNTDTPDFPSLLGLQSLAGSQVSHTLYGSIYVAKLNATGTAIDYATFFGGSYQNQASSIAVDQDGNAIVVGHTDSIDFPTLNAQQKRLADVFNGQEEGDGFVAKLNSAGSDLVFSTYFGGSKFDSIHSVAVDPLGNVYIGGATNSLDFPVLNAFQSASAHPAASGFVSKFTSAGALIYSTYLGGSNDTHVDAIAADGNGDAYVTGSTFALDFPTKNPLQQHNDSQNPALYPNAFVTKLDPTGSALLYSTYYGNTLATTGVGIAVDAAGNAYVVGSGNLDLQNQPDNIFQATPGVTHQIDLGESSGRNGFLTKLNATGSAILYAVPTVAALEEQYSVDDDFYEPMGHAVAIDAVGNAYVVGPASTSWYPTVDPLTVPPPNTDRADVTFLVKYNAAATAVAYSTYLGGSGGDEVEGVAADAAGNVYVAGWTHSSDFPTFNALQPAPAREPFGAHNTLANDFVAKIASPNVAGVLQVVPQPFMATEGIVFTGVVASFTDSDADATFTATIDWGSGVTSAGTIAAQAGGGFVVIATHTFAEEGFFPYAVTVLASDGASATSSGAGIVANAVGLVTYHLSLDTTALANTDGSLAFQFNPGGLPGAQPATATLSQLAIVGGSLTGAATERGGVVGSFANTVAITNSTMLNELIQPLLFGDSISVNVTLSGEALEQPGGGMFGSAFAIQLLTADGTTPRLTSDPSGAVLIADANTDGSSTVRSFASGSNGGEPVAGSNDVVDAPLTLTGLPIQSTAAVAFAGTVAGLADANPSATAADYHATIQWGDGDSSSGDVTPDAAGGFDVAGSHTYATSGTYALNIEVDDVGGSTAVAAPSAVVAAATTPPTVSITGAGLAVTGVEGLSFANVGVATFTIVNGTFDAGTFSATIDWGDGATSTGAVSLLAGTYTVSGSHTYAEEGPQAVTVVIFDEGVAATAQSSAIIDDAPLTLTGLPIQGTAAAAFAGAVARLSDANPSATAADYHATIQWGDGDSSSGDITPDAAGGFDVAGSHTYAKSGTYALNIEVDDVGGSTAVAAPSAVVAPATTPPTVSIAGAGLAVTGVEGLSFANVGVATFAVVNGTFDAGTFSATIDWGDGATSTGAVSLLAGTYTVSGSHSYAEENSYPIEVAVAGAGLSTTVATQATIADASLTATAIAISATEGAAFSGAVANFADADPNGTIGDFTAQVIWGDGTSDAGTIGTGSGGGFVVSGTHTYAADGSKPIAVTIHDVGGSNAAATGAANVAAAPTIETIGGAGLSVSGYEFSPLANIAVATFSSSNLDEPASAFTATIDWGDGMTSAGSVVLTAGTYTVLGSHEYSDEGQFAVHVSIERVSDPTISAAVSAAATVHEQRLAEGSLGTPDQNFIQEVYRDAFERQAEPKGREIWVGLVMRGASREEVAYDILTRATSEEFQQNLVTDLYGQYLHRAPDPEGMRTWVPYLYNGGTIEALTLAIVSCPEYRQDRGGGTAEGFLKAVFQDALGRPIDSPALAFFEGLIAKGISTADVAAAILSSNEFRDVRVNAMIEQFLDRPATPSESRDYAAQLVAGTRDEQIMAQLIASDEYFQKIQG